MPARRSSRSLAVAVVLVATILTSWMTAGTPAGAQSVDSKRAEAREIAAKLDELRDEQQELSAQYERANYERHQAEQEVAEARALAEEKNAEVERRRSELRDFSISAYEMGNDGPGTEALFASGITSGVVKRSYIETTSGNRGDLLDALKAAQKEADEEAERLADAQEEAEARAEEIEEARSAAAERAAEQEALDARVQGELADLVAEEAAARAAAAQRAAATTTTAGSAGPAATGSTAPAPAAAPAPRPSSPAPAPAPAPGPAPSPPPGGGSKASTAISAALSKVGSPYVWGAAGPGSFDCSGLVLWAYRQAGVSLPHYSGAQYAMTTRISAAQLQPGDLVFWGPGGSEHVAIYMGGNQLVHAYSSNRAVGVTSLNGWWKAPSGYGRLNY